MTAAGLVFRVNRFAIRVEAFGRFVQCRRVAVEGFEMIVHLAEELVVSGDVAAIPFQPLELLDELRMVAKQLVARGNQFARADLARFAHAIMLARGSDTATT